MTKPKDSGKPQKETGTFNAIGSGNKRMFGDTALLVSGFTPDEQSHLKAILRDVFPDQAPTVFVDDSLKARTLAELASNPNLGTEGTSSSLPRAIIMSGLTEKELHGVMSAYRSAGLPHPIWASMTPVSSTWSLQALLEELRKEKDELRKAMAAKRAKEAGAP